MKAKLRVKRKNGGKRSPTIHLFQKEKPNLSKPNTTTNTAKTQKQTKPPKELITDKSRKYQNNNNDLKKKHIWAGELVRLY